MHKPTVAISGGFDPIHIGHIKYINAAARLGWVWVILNSDDFLLQKKGFIFMPKEERKELLWSIKNVHNVVECIDKDDTVCETLKLMKPEIFAKGGDRTKDNIPEAKICEELGIEMVFGVGGTDKPQSSSWLVERLICQIKHDEDLRRKYGVCSCVK
jgi:D-beta-D-heptose 7-phosphate kinase/D-beta-D-heptose 1-phosphate adenosyltransferase